MKNMLIAFLIFCLASPIFAAEVINSGATNPVAPYGDYINFGTKIGSAGYGFRTNGGTIEFKNFAGSWGTIGSGTGDVVGPSASTDGELPLFFGTGGKTLKRSNTYTGMLKAASGVLGTATAGTDYVAPNAGITGATNTKITYDAKGLVTAGTAATTADIADSTDKRYVTDAQSTVIGNTSGTNTGDNSANSSTTYVGTTAIALNRASAAQALTGITSIDGNASTVTTNANLTGHVTSTGNAAVLGSFTSANLAGAVSDETGTGNMVFGTSPTFTTQIRTPKIISLASLYITPLAGSNLNVDLSTTGDFAVNTNQLYVDTSSGNVGIGTAAPGSILYLEKSDSTAYSTISSGIYSYSPYPQELVIKNSATGVDSSFTGLFFYAGDTTESVGVNAARINVIRKVSLGADLAFSVRDDSTTFVTERMRITSAGNVGIGTLSPIHKLSVNGTFGVYESYTDASNYSALKLSADSAGLKFTADQLGTGIANRPFVFLQTSSATGTGWDLQTGTGTSKVKWDVSGKQYDGVIGDSSASPGNATLNTISGKSAIAAGQTAMTLTNSNIATTSMIFISPLDVDATALSWKHSVSAGAGVITVNAAATADFKFAWKVIN